MRKDILVSMNLQNNVSFLRIRPCDSDNEIYLHSRKKEGTSSFYKNKKASEKIIRNHILKFDWEEVAKQYWVKVYKDLI